MSVPRRAFGDFVGGGLPVSIGNNVFINCINLTSITFESGSHLTSIGEYAFRGCENLYSIVIPSSVTSIGQYAFSGDTSLASVIACYEIFWWGSNIANSNANFTPFIVAGVFYYIFNLIVTIIMGRVEKSMSYYKI